MKCVKGLVQNMAAGTENTRQEKLEQTTQVKATEAERTDAVLQRWKAAEAKMGKCLAVK